jgi:hypothetical protein
MNPRIRFGLITLAVLFVANIGWRVWASWGLITVHADGQSAATVIRSIEKQAGIRLRTNLPADKQITMHVQKVPLLHALDVLAAQTDTSWSVAYMAAPDAKSIETALGVFSSGQEMEGWKRFSLPAMRGMGGMEEGTSDPRVEEWEIKQASDGTLHAYLEQASHTLTAQFWAPEQWNPKVSSTPKGGEISSAFPKLAKAVNGHSSEVFLLQDRSRRRDMAEGGEAPQEGERRERGSRGGFGAPSEEMRKVMEERMMAQINRLPEDKKADALAEFEERRKFFTEMAQLTPEERRAKMAERMEKEMNNSSRGERMDTGMTKRGAMKNAEQRAERYRQYIDRKNQSSQ